MILESSAANRGIRLRELADICGVSIQEISRQVIRLEETGLVCRLGPSRLKLTEVGFILVKYLDSMESLARLSEYLNMHNVDVLPLASLMLLGEIRNAQVETGLSIGYRMSLDVAKSAQKELKMAAPNTDVAKLVLEEAEESGTLNRLEQVEVILPYVEEIDGKTQELVTTCDISLTAVPVNFLLIKNEERAVVILPDSTGKINSDSCLHITGREGLFWTELTLESLKSRVFSEYRSNRG